MTKSKIDIEDQKEKLREIVEEYVKTRASKCLVYGCLHEAESNIHFHLMISSNEIGKQRNYRLTREKFSEIKKQLEKYVLDKHPELEQKIVIDKAKKLEYNSQKEFELKKRTGTITKKETIQVRLMQIFNLSSSKEQFFKELQNANIQIYTRGKNIGFLDNSDDKKRKYRLNKLGLSEEFNKMSEILSKEMETIKTELTPETKKEETRKQESEQLKGKTEEIKLKEEPTPEPIKQERKAINTEAPIKEENQKKEEPKQTPFTEKEILQEEKKPAEELETKEQEALNELKRLREQKQGKTKKKKM